jgi:AraC-like DNA-binding protein
MGYKESNPSENYTSLSFQDKDFVDRCQNLVEKNLSNIEYGVDSLSQDMYMSRMNLYRKLREITGKTPTEFIRDIRLVHSLMLLQTTSYSINEISDLVGFSYPSYFTKCFKDKYKKSPKSFLSDN